MNNTDKFPNELSMYPGPIPEIKSTFFQTYFFPRHSKTTDRKNQCAMTSGEMEAILISRTNRNVINDTCNAP
jgi:hypothetical protein